MSDEKPEEKPEENLWGGYTQIGEVANLVTQSMLDTKQPKQYLVSLTLVVSKISYQKKLNIY